MKNLNLLTPFKYFTLTNFPYIEADFDALTNYELFCKIVEYINEISTSQNDVIENFNELLGTWNAYKAYIDYIYENLGEYVNDKIDEMAENGTLANIMSPLLPPIINEWLIAHPEATTTVQDGALTEPKFAESLKLKTIKDYLTPEMFGAKGDGITDDTIAVQEAIDTARDENKAVFFNDKTYICNIVVYPFTQLIGGSHSILKSAPNSNKSVIKSYDFDDMSGTSGPAPTDAGLYMTFLSHLIIDGNRDNNESGYGIEVWGRNLFFDHLFIFNCTSGGMYTEFSTHGTPASSEESFYANSLESVFSTIKIYDCFGNGWTYKGPHDSHILNYICIKCKEYALHCSGYSNGLIIDHMNSWFTKHGVLITGGSRILSSQIDSAGYDGTDFTGKGIEITSGHANVQIDDTTIRNFAKGLVLSGTYHQISALLQTNTVSVEATNTNSSKLDLIIASKSGIDQHIFDLSQASNNIVTAYIHGYANNTLFGSGVPTSTTHGKWELRGDQDQFYYNIESNDTPSFYRGGYHYYDQINTGMTAWTPLNATANTGNRYRINGYQIRFDVDLSLTEAFSGTSLALYTGVKSLINFSTSTFSGKGFAIVDGWNYTVELSYNSTTDTISLINVGSHSILANATIRGSIIIEIAVQ